MAVVREPEIRCEAERARSKPVKLIGGGEIDLHEPEWENVVPKTPTICGFSVMLAFAAWGFSPCYVRVDRFRNDPAPARPTNRPPSTTTLPREMTVSVAPTTSRPSYGL